VLPYNSSVGRLTFGDKGSSDQKETPFIIDQTHPTYYIGAKEFYVGNALVKTEFQAIFDTGTSFTHLADPVYKSFTSNYQLQTRDSPWAVDQSSIPFEFCYKTSNSQSINRGPNISFNFNGGNNFSVIQPMLFLQDVTGKLLGYCLGVLHSPNITIIGQNFMTGYRLVFDREQLKLGWMEANCYDLKYSNISTSTSSPVGDNPSTSSINSSTNSPPKLYISPNALPVNPNVNSNDAIHLSLYFSHIPPSFSLVITIITILL